MTLTSNTATGGAGGIGGVGGNGGGAFGGALLAYNLQSQVSYSNFSLNIATGGAGAGPATQAQGLAGSARGGAVDNMFNLTLTGNSFVANSVIGGTGATAGNGNNGSAVGGAIVSDARVYPTTGPLPTLNMVNDTLTENSAIGGGGGFGATTQGSSGGGGALYNNASTAIVTECTFRENTATGGLGGNGFGGGIYNGNQSGTLTLTFSTLTFNSATWAYGGLYGGGVTTLSFDNITFNNAPNFPDM